MKISIEVFGAQHEAAAGAFNDRMRAGKASTDFLLNGYAPRVRGDVTAAQYVAVDETGAVRGGVLSWEHPAIVAGEVRRVINLQSPLSEGIIDPAYVVVASQLVRFSLRQSAYVYVVGMGGEHRPMPRMLKAMGWRVYAAPFYFRIINARRCVRELGPLRNSAWKRMAGRVAGITGAASIAAYVWHRGNAAECAVAKTYTTEEVTSWAEWANEVWSSFAGKVSFSVCRDLNTLPFFYPVPAKKLRVCRLVRRNAVEGWFAITISDMRSNAYFGDLRVATLTDCIGSAEAIRSGCVHAVAEAKRLGADLLVTNQTHRTLRDSCIAAGWRSAPSNFLIATSPKLTPELQEQSVYITRRDGDGLANLWSPS